MMPSNPAPRIPVRGLLLCAFLSGCVSHDKDSDSDSGTPGLPDISGMTLGTLHEVGLGQFIRVIPSEAGFFVFRGDQGIYQVDEYDDAWNPTGFSCALTRSDRVSFDNDLAWDGTNVYYDALYGTNGAIYRHETEGFEATASSEEFPADTNEAVGDQDIEVIDGMILAGDEYREEGGSWAGNLPPNDEVARGLRLRVFSTDLDLLDERDLVADLDGAAVPWQFWGKGASQLSVAGDYHLVVASAIGDTTVFDEGESRGARQIFLARFDDDFQFVDSTGPLTDTANDNYWSTGSWYEDGNTFLSYTFRTPEDGPVLGPPASDQGNIALSIFGEGMAEITHDVLTDASPEQIEQMQGAHRSHILKVGDTLYVSYDRGSFGYVQEVRLIRG